MRGEGRELVRDPRFGEESEVAHPPAGDPPPPRDLDLRYDYPARVPWTRAALLGAAGFVWETQSEFFVSEPLRKMISLRSALGEPIEALDRFIARPIAPGYRYAARLRAPVPVSVTDELARALGW